MAIRDKIKDGKNGNPADDSYYHYKIFDLMVQIITVWKYKWGSEPRSHLQLYSTGIFHKPLKTPMVKSQKGQIGITLNSPWVLPYQSNADTDAASRALAFAYDWYKIGYTTKQQF
ncbi:beta-glucosidase 14 [Quercus suber]|uniref:Beta-glucosidase 14 n=1 Tax=Quercus suber TaxID=58331 RepID=A0AAW0LCV3_QUESU